MRGGGPVIASIAASAVGYDVAVRPFSSARQTSTSAGAKTPILTRPPLIARTVTVTAAPICRASPGLRLSTNMPSRLSYCGLRRSARHARHETACTRQLPTPHRAWDARSVPFGSQQRSGAFNVMREGNLRIVVPRDLQGDASPETSPSGGVYQNATI